MSLHQSCILSYRRKLFGSSVFDVGASEPGLGALGSSAIVILVSGGRLSMVWVDYDTGNVAARGEWIATVSYW